MCQKWCGLTLGSLKITNEIKKAQSQEEVHHPSPVSADDKLLYSVCISLLLK